MVENCIRKVQLKKNKKEVRLLANLDHILHVGAFSSPNFYGRINGAGDDDIIKKQKSGDSTVMNLERYN